MRCTWLQCQSDAAHEIRALASNAYLGSNCDEHIPKKPLVVKDYIIKPLSEAEQAP